MRKAPWADYEGNAIYEGDKIKHPSGESGTVVFWNHWKIPEDQWRVDYGIHLPTSRLCLQIGDRGKAVVCKSCEAANEL